MPTYNALVRDARLDAIDFLRDLITDPARLIDEDGDELDLPTIHHRRLAATALLRLKEEQDDFEYEAVEDDESDTENDNAQDDTEPDAEDSNNGDALDSADGGGNADARAVLDANTDAERDAGAGACDTGHTGANSEPVNDDAGIDEAAHERAHNTAPVTHASPPTAPLVIGRTALRPEGAHDRSQERSEAVFERAQPVARTNINVPRPEGAHERSHGWSEGVFARAEPVEKRC